MPIPIPLPYPQPNKYGSKIRVIDRFNRPDKGALGRTETGQAWEVLSGTWGIDNQNATVITGVASDNSIAFHDTVVSDCLISSKFVTISNYCGLVARLTNISNFVFVEYSTTNTALRLYKIVDGVYTQLASKTLTMNSGDIVSLKAQGASLKTFINGVEQLSVSDNFNLTATKHGLRQYDDAVTRWGNFKVEVI